MENNNNRRLECCTSSDDELIMPAGCFPDPGRRRRTNQVFRERRRRLRMLVQQRLLKIRRSGTPSEDMEDLQSRRRHRPPPCRAINLVSDFTLNTTTTTSTPARRIQQQQDNNPQRSSRICWSDIAFAILSVVILIMFLETHIETWITGRPPHRFSCYLCGAVICTALWCLLMMQNNFDGDLRDRN